MEVSEDALLSPKPMVKEMIDRSMVAWPAKLGPQISRPTPTWMLIVSEVNSRSMVKDAPRWMPAEM